MAQAPPPPLDPKIAELLRTTVFEAPPSDAKRRVRTQLELAGLVSMEASHAGVGRHGPSPSTKLPSHFPAGAEGGPLRATHGLAKHLVAKSAVTLLVSVAVGVAGALMTARPAPRAPIDELRAREGAALPARANEERSSASVSTLRNDEPEPPALRSPGAPQRGAPSVAKRPGALDSLDAEQRLLARARIALGHGDPESAVHELDQHAHLFPNGHLTEEREALRIVTLARQGKWAAARERAARFRRAYPRSIQLSTVDAAVAERP